MSERTPARARPSAPRPLADLLGACLGPALAKQGFAGADIVVNWPEIVGETLSRRSLPVRIAWPRKAPGAASAPQHAALHIRVESAFALELQHLAPVVIERVNAYFGWACIGRVKLEQGPVGRRAVTSAARLEPTPAAQASAEAAAVGIADEELRAALVRLGAAVITRERSAPGAKT